MASQPSPSFTLSLATIQDHTFLSILTALTVIGLGALMLNPGPALRWFKLKRYQYEVTFSLYMLTPTEKFIFNSILFLFLSMVTIAMTLYLPSHVSTITRRAYYYALGDVEAGNAVIKESAASVSSRLAARTASQVVESLKGSDVTRGAAEAVRETVGAISEKLAGS